MSALFCLDDFLYFVPSEGRDPCFVAKVVSVGRIWVTVYGAGRYYRFRKSDPRMASDGGAYPSPGRCFRDEREYTEYRNTTSAWAKFRMAVSGAYAVPEDATIEAIAEATRLLGLRGTA